MLIPMNESPLSVKRESHRTQLSRRAFLVRGGLLLSAAMVSRLQLAQLHSAQSVPKEPALRIGLITDVHYADKPEAKTRYYRESLNKIQEGIDRFNRGGLDFVIELGDLIDSAESVEGELASLKKVNLEFARFQGDRHYVLGNHDVWTLTKEQFLANCGREKEFYSFDRNGFHFVLLDACYRSDGVAYGKQNFRWNDADIPPAQRDWLKADLQRAGKPTVVFVHQRLDVRNEHGVKSAPAVRKILEESKNVLAVFQGHSHKNDYREIGGIHYCTLCAAVEGSGEQNNAYSVLSLGPNGSLSVEGFRRQQNYTLVGTA